MVLDAQQAQVRRSHWTDLGDELMALGVTTPSQKQDFAVYCIHLQVE